MNLLWKKRIQSAGWLTLTAAGVVLLIAGVQKKDHKKCAGIKVEVSGVNKHIFLDEKEALKILNANGELVGQPLQDINLQLLEDRLEKDKWIRNAELFFDNNQLLQVSIEEREPIARIFTVRGNSYYIDSSGRHLPLSDKLSARVPMFTNFPVEGTRLRMRDSLLLASIKELANFIQADSFWNAQVAQVDITPDRTFEIVPTIGNHIVAIGKGKDIEEKFKKLYTFYREVWTKVGLEKYSKIDVQYKGQVVATKRGESFVSVDSSKAQEAFLNLLQANKPDTIEGNEIKVKPAVAKAPVDVKKEIASSTTSLAAKVKSEIAKADAEKKDKDGDVKMKDTEVTTKEKPKQEKEKKKPKAVMVKKTN